MKQSILTYLVAGFCVLSTSAEAKPLRGHTSFSGAVIATPCSIMLEDRWQVVDMGDVALRDLFRSGLRPERDVVIRLEGCQGSVLNGKGRAKKADPAVRVRFDGLRGRQPHLFGTGGLAGSPGLMLQDVRRERVIPGEYQPAFFLGKKTAPELKYRLTLLPDGRVPEAGSYSATLQFGMVYE